MDSIKPNKDYPCEESLREPSILDQHCMHSNTEDWGRMDAWIYLSIEGKRREIIKQQMMRHINRMKTLCFQYHV